MNLIGSSKAMQDIYEIIEEVAKSDANIMIFGESGTGKELIANFIHFKSLRAKKPMVKIKCSALPKEEIESVLFGHTKGAFTGVATEKTGLIGRAKGGSLLLDEIGEMPVELQPKLLRVLQERVYYPFGQRKDARSRFPLDFNDEPRPAGGDTRRTFAGRLLLPYQRDRDPRAAAARPRRGHPASGQIFPENLC
jgi:DNA-binding NtrC family response regulator